MHRIDSGRLLIQREIAVSLNYFQQWAINQHQRRAPFLKHTSHLSHVYIQTTGNTNHPINNSNIYHPSIDLLNMKTVPLFWNTNIVRSEASNPNNTKNRGEKARTNRIRFLKDNDNGIGHKDTSK